MSIERDAYNRIVIEELKDLLQRQSVHIVLSGASSIGKTTLAYQAGHELNVPVIPEQARVIIEENSWSRTQLQDVSIFLALQREIVKRQMELERNAFNLSHCSDSSIFDAYVYAQMFLRDSYYADFIKESKFSDHITTYKHAVFFIIQPRTITFQDDGTRIVMGLQFAEVFNANIKKILNLHALPYEEITSETVDARKLEMYEKLYRHFV